MIFTQGHGFVLEHRLACSDRRSVVACWFCHAVDTASLATSILFGKLYCVATLLASVRSGVVKTFR